MKIKINKIDYNDSLQGKDLIELLDDYAKDPMGGNAPLSFYTKENLLKKLADLPNAFSLIAYIDNEAAGLVNCFFNFSTFACKKILNIHDIIVAKKHRQKGIGASLLQETELIALKNDCCKITLEVLSNNIPAKNLYEKTGFKPYQLSPEKGFAMFWEKKF